MTVNPLHCTLSRWTGADDECRWCSSVLLPEQKRWCSGKCLETWRLQHRYYLARQLAVKLAKGKCDCVRKVNEERHIICANCNLCESRILLRGGSITCDHIVPRRGDKSRFSCKHHQTNLQILCSQCHDQKSRMDEKTYGD
jgi:5-methylcytosine-specific restriction endonuclease McrA